MNKKNITFALALATFIFLAVLAASPLAVLAKDGERSEGSGSGKQIEPKPEIKKSTDTKSETENETETHTESETEKSRSLDGSTATKREDRKEVAREKLDDAKKKTCAEREANINAAMDRIVERSQKHIDRITAVSDKAKAFYIEKRNVLSNYDQLVANVEQKRAAAQAAVDALSTTATFSCDSDGPKSDIQNFHNDRAGKIEAVGAYRTAVKELIAGIKSVQPVDTSTEAQS